MNRKVLIRRDLVFNEDAKWNKSENEEKIAIDQGVQVENVNVNLKWGSSSSSTTSSPTSSSESCSSDEDTPPTKFRSLAKKYELAQFVLITVDPTSFHEVI